LSEADFSALLSRVVARLEQLNESRLNAVEQSARACIQNMADLARESEGLGDTAVPDIGILGLPGQFAVIGSDLLAISDSPSLESATALLRMFKQDLDLI
jgi:hypothetical protein